MHAIFLFHLVIFDKRDLNSSRPPGRRGSSYSDKALDEKNIGLISNAQFKVISYLLPLIACGGRIFHFNRLLMDIHK